VPSLCIGLTTALRVIGAVATNARDDFVIGDLVERARQRWRVTGGVVCDLDGPNLQRGRVNVQVDLAPLATLVGTMLLGRPLTFAQHLDTGAVDK
jgi:hypothetical protein